MIIEIPMETTPTDPKTVKSRLKRYDETFKQRVLEHWRSTGKSAAEVATSFGVSAYTLYMWRKKMGALPAGGAGNGARPTMEELEKENCILRRELADMREQRDILKKVTGILSENPLRATNGLRK